MKKKYEVVIWCRDCNEGEEPEFFDTLEEAELFILNEIDRPFEARIVDTETGEDIIK